MSSIAKKRLNRELIGKFISFGIKLPKLNEAEQKQKIMEMNGMIDEMNKNDLDYVMSVTLFGDINELINHDKMTAENATLFFRNMGYFKLLFLITDESFDVSSLGDIFRRMIFKEKRRKEEKNEKLLIDLIECFLSMTMESETFPKDVYSYCVSSLLNVAQIKEENEEAQKEVEMALLALSNINKHCRVEKELYLNEVTEIIKYHQDHHNLTRLAYQSVWQFLGNRLDTDKSLNEVIVNELHFGKEAKRELEELSKCVNWKKEKENWKEQKEVSVMKRWINTISNMPLHYRTLKGKFDELICCLVKLCRASRNDEPELSDAIIKYFHRQVYLSIYDFSILESDILVLFLEDIQQSTLKKTISSESLELFLYISRGLEDDVQQKGTKEKALKREALEKFEEQGYEDIINSFRHMGKK
ncbi:uncharacterized protein MONOS_11455 [Monocercomonoides exilis]|uniref:uncharacterized protein n=1 Tax=Monocercomonoides exilis TaxID=2049356 RepID=UPI003559E97F|nr:hypothetical protein MONOS_11455 [Monocercomonoides exilis]|eukprot:MONOS_11455.1-p1 / transcript=MONOS_11455.1 / gene=MONOS_11455 / organism=Monocercomonoides_exilis_PA203 / gene_product=unspecified product / transcript_product=unspecified product / location=Mono_scaffold00576:18765-20128(-) / protein_length=416 / sequence_SO=supercontig / SO=protein_coding / is_pseudo=false